ncbi:hypothetical protein D3C71_1362540 [compost metagenome]
MGKVVTWLAFKRQFAVMQLGIVSHIGGQACAGEMRGIVQTDVVLNHFGLGAAPNLKMMTVMYRIHFACSTASAADMQQVQRA